jgi:hypothetical protein
VIDLNGFSSLQASQHATNNSANSTPSSPSSASTSPHGSGVPSIHVIDEDEEEDVALNRRRRKKRSSNGKSGSGYHLDAWQLADYFSSV